MVEQQQKLILSQYMNIYNLVVPQDNLLRKFNELIDFSFIYDELIDKYCLNNGRNAISPIRMFKYLLLKFIFDLSDVDIVERSKYDISFKYFLDMAPEEDVNLLDMLINKTVSIALEKGIIKSKSIIIDATHIAMSEERIITAAAITTGEKNDGKELEILYHKSKETGMKIDTIIGDAAYSEKGSIELAEEEKIKLVAKLNPSVTQGFRKKEDEFQFNKDAGMYVCKAGHMA